jgi:hypothetical protein
MSWRQGSPLRAGVRGRRQRVNLDYRDHVRVDASLTGRRKWNCFGVTPARHSRSWAVAKVKFSELVREMVETDCKTLGIDVAACAVGA